MRRKLLAMLLVVCQNRTMPMKEKFHRSSRYVLLAGALAMLLVIAAVVALQPDKTPSAGDTTKLVLPGANNSSTTFTLETVKTTADQEKGLSGRQSLAKDSGMLFEYSQVGQRCMWMKDMHFNIDIVWLDNNNRITSIAPNVSPASYPHNYCANAQRVIELPAGTASQEVLRVGQIMKP